MTRSTRPIAAGELWSSLQAVAAAALATGALRPIETAQTRLEDQGVGFLVRTASNLQRKAEDQARQQQGQAPDNPFLAPEPELLVGDIGPDHRAVLNKFNVLEHHLLIVTREFEHQERLLNLADFRALCWGLAELNGLGFYNGGEVAGASQAHKHLQLAPLPLSGGETAVPMASAFGELPAGFLFGRLPGLPFNHVFAPLPPTLWDHPQNAAAHARDLYQEMLGFVGIGEIEHAAGEMHQSRPYNLLMTRQWMLLVPRSEECVGPISVNALGFAGSLFIKNPADMDLILDQGPMQILCRVSDNA